MIKVLLADNNQVSLSYFKELVDFEKLGFEIVSTAVDGKEAYRDFLHYRPEVIISDIHMPYMTGIELASKVKQIEPETIIIFLSSYEELESVRSALSLRVNDYILKQETTKETLINKLLAVRKIIEKQQEKNRYYYESSLYSMMEEYEDTSNLINTNTYQKIFPSKYHAFVVEQNHVLSFIVDALQYPIKEYPESKMKRISYSISSAIVAIVKVAPFRYLVVMKSNGKDVPDCAYDYKNKLEEISTNHYAVVVLAESACIKDCLYQYYHNLIRIKNMRFYMESVILYYQKTIDERVKSTRRDFKEIQKHIINQNYDQLMEEVNHRYNQISHSKNYEEFEALSKILFRFVLQYHNKILDYQDNVLFYAYNENSSIFWKDATSFIHWQKKKIEQLIQVLRYYQICDYSLEVERALQYINQNYANANLSAEMIAEKVNMNINHLNTIFKKETGDTVWKRLMQIRILKAKHLLDTKDNRIGKVYTQVGFNSLSYFSTVFRKNYGYSPQEYKKKNQSLNEGAN